MPRMPIDAAGPATDGTKNFRFFEVFTSFGGEMVLSLSLRALYMEYGGHCTHCISKYLLHCARKYLKFEVKVKWRNILHFWINVTCLRKCASHSSLVSKYSLQILHGNISQISGSVGKNLFTVLLYVISPKAIGSWIENH